MSADLIHLDVTFEPRLANLRAVSARVEALCLQLDLDETTRYHVELAVVEAVTNCIRHAGDGDEPGPMHLRARLRDDMLVITVTDQAEPGGLDLRPEESKDTIPAELDEGGRGLFLICSLMDHVEHRSDPSGNTLTMTKALR